MEVVNKDDKTIKLELILGYLSCVAVFQEMFCLYFEKARISQTKLAKKLTVDPSTIAHWRKNRRIPENSAQVYQIARALELGPRERQYLLRAWTTHKTLTDITPYIKEAYRSGDDVDVILQAVGGYLEDELGNLSLFES